MNTKENLYKKIKEICISQLCEANTQKSPYKARYAQSDPDDEKSYKIQIEKSKARAHIEALIKPDKYEDYNDIFRILLISGQNRNRMPKVIKFMEREGQFKKILCGTKAKKFNHKKILKSFYNEAENKEQAASLLLKQFKEKFEIKEDTITETGDMSKKHRSLWYQYALFVIDAALFMKNICENKNIKTDNILEEFKSRLNSLIYPNGDHKLSDEVDLAHPAYIAENISGIGFTLACDFLKEIGYPIAKPDLHIFAFLRNNCKKRFESKKKKIKDTLPKKIPLEEAAAIKVMESIAKKHNCDVYALDKLIWLGCSGNYYEKNKFEGIIVTPKSQQSLFLATL